MSVCVGGGGWVMCGCFDNCVGDLAMCILGLTVFCVFSCMCVFILICY